MLKLKKRTGKKGSLQDITFIGLVLVFTAIVALLAFKMSSEFNDFIQGNDNFESHGKSASSSLNSNFTGVVDGSFLFLVVGMAMGALVLALLVRVHPIFIPFFFIGLIFIIFLSGIMSNIYQEMSEQPQLENEASQLSIIDTVLTYLPIMVGTFGILLMVIMYKLWKADVVS